MGYRSKGMREEERKTELRRSRVGDLDTTTAMPLGGFFCVSRLW